jgi:sarcosine oxidase
MKTSLQTIVIGLGAMGSAATYQLAKRGNHVLGIDQFFPPHIYGSSHGDTRITRQAIRVKTDFKCSRVGWISDTWYSFYPHFAIWRAHR